MGFLTLSGSFLKVNALFPVVLGGVFLAIKSYLASPLSDQLVAAYPVPVDQVPVFSAVLMAFYAFFSGIIAIMVTSHRIIVFHLLVALSWQRSGHKSHNAFF